MDVQFEDLIFGAIFVLLEILTKSFRFKILKNHALDQISLDFASIVLALGLHIGIAMMNVKNEYINLNVDFD